MSQPTREELMAMWDAWSEVEQNNFLCWFANWRPDYTMCEHLKAYVVPLDQAVRDGLPQEAVDDLLGTIPNTEGYFDLGLSERLPMTRGVVARHPTVGWVTFIPDPDLATEPAILWHDRNVVPPDVFALAVAYCPRWGQPAEPSAPLSPELAAIVDDILSDL